MWGVFESEFFRQRLVQALVFGASYIALDFPRANGTASNRAEEDAQGRSRAYLVDYWPDEVINWNYDETGGLDWNSHFMFTAVKSN